MDDVYEDSGAALLASDAPPNGALCNEMLRQIRAATEQQDGSYHYNPGMAAFPFAAPAHVEFDEADDWDDDGPVAALAEDSGRVVAGTTLTERVRGSLGGLGFGAATLAVTGLTAGASVAATPAAALGLFAVMLGGLSLLTVRVFCA